MAIVVGAILAGVRFEIVSEAWAGILCGGWILKEIVLFPFVRSAYETSDPNATSNLIGKLAVVTKRLEPRGTVRLGPELWGARIAAGLEPVETGARVCVKSVEGLTLHVEPALLD
jgi:membrane protein implicated in regulation of membrane protease activity